MRRVFSSLFCLLALLQSVSVWAAAERIVTLAPSWSHTVAEMGGIDNLVGVTRYARFPEAVPARVRSGELTVVGGFTDIKLEKILAQNPDLVLTASPLQLELKAKLEAKGIDTLHMQERSVDDIYAKFLALGERMGKQDQAKALVDKLKSDIASISETYQQGERPKVYYELNYYYKCVPGADSYIRELIELAGGEPLFAERPGNAPAVTWEEVVAANPDIILIPIWPGAQPAVFEGPRAGNGTTTIKEVMGRKDADKVAAVQHGGVRFIDSAVTKQPSPGLAKAVQLFAEAIHGQ